MDQRFVLSLQRILTILFLMVTGGVSAQNCNWTVAPSSISEACGFVGIGTTAPEANLHVKSQAFGYSVYGIIERTSVGADGAMIFRTSGANASDWHVGKSGTVWNDNLFFSFGGFPAPNLVLTTGGRVGIGTSAPISPLHQWSNSANNPTTVAIADAAVKDGLLTLNAAAVGQQGGGGGILLGGNAAHQFFAAFKALLMDGSGNTTGDIALATRNSTTDGALTERMRILANGNVGIGTPSPTHKLHVAGDGHFAGTVTGQNLKAHFQDVAEWVPCNGDLPAATVVVLKRDEINTVIASTRAYDAAVAGVVSAQPGLSLGVEGPGKVQVATTGRVKVRVDATPAPIEVGDLLVTSDIVGTAMRSDPIAINGRSFHQPGTIIGKALEPLAEGMGEILVLLSLQ